MNNSPLLKFLNARQIHCDLPLDIVKVTWIGGGNLNECFLNAYNHSVELDLFLVSGWLALIEDEEKKQKQFTQHWWNKEKKTGEYLDFSPNIEEGAIYISDPNIAEFAHKNNNVLTSCVPRSVMHAPTGFHTLETAEKGFFIEETDKLSNEVLYAPYILDRSKS